MKSYIKELMKKGAQKLAGQTKTTGKEGIRTVDIAKDLTTKRNIQDNVVKTVDKAFKDADPQGVYTQTLASKKKKAELKRDEGKKLKGFSYKLDKIEDKIDKRNKASKKLFKFNKGGRVGLKRGTGLMKKKSNIQKINETFAPKVSKNKKALKFGMLSVKAGIDKNPNPTQADRIAGAKMKNRMKASFGGGADMGKVASDKTKTEVKKYEKRAKDASKFLKNKGRSFGNIMREKHMR